MVGWLVKVVFIEKNRIGSMRMLNHFSVAWFFFQFVLVETFKERYARAAENTHYDLFHNSVETFSVVVCSIVKRR